jgi:hypothetical protein
VTAGACVDHGAAANAGPAETHARHPIAALEAKWDINLMWEELSSWALL